VNSYAAASENTPVNFVNNVDFPTDGNPTNPTRQSPVLVTSKPSPLGPPFGPDASINSRCNFASLARSDPKCVAVALFFCVRLISSSIAAIFSMVASDMTTTAVGAHKDDAMRISSLNDDGVPRCVARALDDACSACVDLAGCRRTSVARLASRARVTNVEKPPPELRARARMLVLPEDERALADERARDDEALAWGRALRAGDGDERRRALVEMLAAVRADEEYVCAIGRVDGALAAVVGGEFNDGENGEGIVDLASEVFESCARATPPGASFPARGLAQPGRFALAHVGSSRRPLTLRLRLVRERGLTRSVSGMVWHSALALARWISREETLAWTRARFFREGERRRCLEIGGGTMIAGMTFAVQCGESWDVVMTDAAPDAVKNARYNVERLDANLKRAGLARRATTATLDWNDDDAFHEENARSFDVVLGSDVVHEEHMAGGVFRALTRYLAPGGVAMIVLAAPHSRGGAETFQNLLRAHEDEFIVRTRRIKNAIVCVGIEEECEDVPLDAYMIARRRGDDGFEPPLEVLD